jgi:hypothetical protein
MLIGLLWSGLFHSTNAATVQDGDRFNITLNVTSPEPDTWTGTFTIFEDQWGYWHVDEFALSNGIQSGPNEILRRYLTEPGWYPDPENEGPLNQAIPSFDPLTNQLCCLHDFAGGAFYWRETTWDVDGDIGIYAGTYQVTPVPIPAVGWLLAVAFAGIARRGVTSTT